MSDEGFETPGANASEGGSAASGGFGRGFRRGDRVRICEPNGEYTGCRGTIADDAAADAQGVLPLGHMVAVDGENGIARPFLIQHLEPLQPARVRRAADESVLPAASLDQRRGA